MFFGALLRFPAFRRGATLTLRAQSILFNALTSLGERLGRGSEFRALRIELTRLGEQGLGRAKASAIDFFACLQHYLAGNDGQPGLRGGIAGVVAQCELVVITCIVVGGRGESFLIEPLAGQREYFVHAPFAARVAQFFLDGIDLTVVRNAEGTHIGNGRHCVFEAVVANCRPRGVDVIAQLHLRYLCREERQPGMFGVCAPDALECCGRVIRTVFQ